MNLPTPKSPSPKRLVSTNGTEPFTSPLAFVNKGRFKMSRFCSMVFIGVLWCISLNAQLSTSALQVSVIHLITDPERYNGQLVSIRGYCYFGLERHAVFLSKEDADNSNISNGVWIDISNVDPKIIKRSHKRWCMIIGVFEGKPCEKPSCGGYGHLGLWQCQLTNVVIRRL